MNIWIFPIIDMFDKDIEIFKPWMSGLEKSKLIFFVFLEFFHKYFEKRTGVHVLTALWTVLLTVQDRKAPILGFF